MFLLVVVAKKLAIDPDLPDAVSFAYLNPTLPRLPVQGRPLFPFVYRRRGLLVGHVRLLRFWRAHFSEEHHGANEFLRIIVGFAVAVFVPGHAHRFNEPFSQMVDKTWLGPGHVGDQRLKDPFMRQHSPFEIGRFRACL
ncbi:MAG: hypothetical protein LJE62_00850 [Silicimonas sp.]|nr:hypothetical protein [Silicimonas sp.]